jgi:NAD(P)H-hydrate epimerase
MGGSFPALRPFAVGELRVWSAAEAAAFDAWAIETVGVPQPVLMENAGRATAALVARLYPEGAVVALAGSGNNGGDALVAVRTLRAWGREARAVLVAGRSADDPLLHGWEVAVTADDTLETALAGAAVVLDGVLGTGARGAPRERQARAIERVNASHVPVLAVDVPSGIDATTGAVPAAAIRADVTVSFGAPKLGALLHPARALVGRLVVVEIGFPPLDAEPGTARVIDPAWARARLPRRDTDTHKNRVGRVCVVAGRPGMAGAAILSALGAFRAGAGFVRVASVPENRAAIQAAVPEALFIEATDGDALADALAQTDALAVGPGLGTDERARGVLDAVLAGPALPTVLDADALNLAAAGAVDLAAVARARPLLLAPHPGEMGRLLGDEAAPTDPATRARAAAERFGCAILLKGAPSLVAAPGAPLSIDTQSSSDLAVAGMGDVLTGVCAALVAQGLTPDVAGSVGLYLTGRSARIAGRGVGLTPSDVLRWLAEALTEPGAPETDLDLPFVVFDADAPR